MTNKVINFQSFVAARKAAEAVSAAETAPQEFSKISQLALAIDPQMTVWVFPLEYLHGTVFIEKLDALKPTAVLDFRHFKHFNLTGTSVNSTRQALVRLSPFVYAEDVTAEFFSATQESIVSLFSNAFSKVKSQKLPAGPLFMLVEGVPEATAALSAWKEYFKSLGGGWTVELVLEADAIAL